MTRPNPIAQHARALRLKRNARIIAMYRRGMSCRAIAEKVGSMTGAGVREVLVKAGVPRRSEGGWPDDRPLSRDRRRLLAAVREGRLPRSALERRKPALRGYPTKLTVRQVRAIKNALIRGEPFAALRRRYGVAESSILGIAMNRSWKHVPWPNRTGYVRRPKRSGTHKLQPADVRRIRKALARADQTLTAIAARHGVARGTIRLIRQGTIWKSVR